MKENSLSGALLEQDVRQKEADKNADSQSKPLEDIIALARDEITAVFAKRQDRRVAVSR